MITARIWPDGQMWEYELTDERPPRMKSTGASRTLEGAIESVMSDLSALRLDK